MVFRHKHLKIFKVLDGQSRNDSLEEFNDFIAKNDEHIISIEQKYDLKWSNNAQYPIAYYFVWYYK